MKLKNLFIGIIAIAILAAVLWKVKNQENKGSKQNQDMTIIDPDVMRKVSKISLSGGNSADEVLITKGNNQEWLLPEHHEFPVDFNALSRLTTSLNDATIVRKVTSNPERMKRLELGTSHIVLRDKSDKSLFDMKIGKRNDTGGIYVSFSDRSAAYLLKDSIYVDANADSWINKKPIKWDEKDIKSFSMSFKSEPLITLNGSRETAEKEYTSALLAFDETINQNEVKSFINLLLDINFSKYQNRDNEDVKAAMSHASKYTLETFEGITFDILIGQKPVEKQPEPKEGEANNAPPPAPIYMVLDVKSEGKSWYKPAEEFAFETQRLDLSKLPDLREKYISKQAPTPAPAETVTEAIEINKAPDAVKSEVKTTAIKAEASPETEAK